MNEFLNYILNKLMHMVYYQTLCSSINYLKSQPLISWEKVTQIGQIAVLSGFFNYFIDFYFYIYVHNHFK